MVSSRFWILAFSAISLSLATLPAVANPFDDDDLVDDDDDDDNNNDKVVSGEYTCNPRLDYSSANTCKTIQNGICDNPNHGGGGGKDCFEQDCIDCNYFCGEFDADCFGCLNAVGCYYCPEDASCKNSDMYLTTDKTKVTCTVREEYWLGGRDDPDKLCILSDSPTPQSTSNPTSVSTIANIPTVKKKIKKKQKSDKKGKKSDKKYRKTSK